MDKTGGPAFPVLELNPVSGNIQAQHLGLSLRDYFAGQIVGHMVGACYSAVAGGGDAKKAGEVITKAGIAAYELADAMLAARGEAGNG